MDATPAYLEVVDFIATGPTPDRIAAFRPSDAARKRVLELLQRQQTGEIQPQEASELDDYLQLEHLMRLIKDRARQHLAA
ncbi:MAG TPA: hypothetical protein VFY65_02730 [Longimicrobium sp.]|nr:hypothetical protein [Longimicrobium sp.]